MGASTIDAQCGSSQQAVHFAAGLIAAGAADVVLACGVESMSRVPLGTSMKGPGRQAPPSYKRHYELTSQFEGAERIAGKWVVSREDTDAFGLRSHERALSAQRAGYFDAELVSVEARDFVELDAGDPAPDDYPSRPLLESSHWVRRDEGPRQSTLEKLAGLRPVHRPVHRPDSVHTAATTSQISDGSAAVMLMSRPRAEELGVRPRARIVGQCLVGSDPVLMLTGPIEVTRRLLPRLKLSLADTATIEINEAFASVVLAWQRELGLDEADMFRVNPNGGAIALGHPVGATGARLVTTALHTLERIEGRYGFVTMCCGGGLGTGIVIERET